VKDSNAQPCMYAGPSWPERACFLPLLTRSGVRRPPPPPSMRTCILPFLPPPREQVTLGPGAYSIEETAYWSERVYRHAALCYATLCCAVHCWAGGAGLSCRAASGTPASRRVHAYPHLPPPIMLRCAPCCLGNSRPACPPCALQSLCFFDSTAQALPARCCRRCRRADVRPRSLLLARASAAT
jgi:hypothetical protein